MIEMRLRNGQTVRMNGEAKVMEEVMRLWYVSLHTHELLAVRNERQEIIHLLRSDEITQVTHVEAAQDTGVMVRPVTGAPS